MQSAVPIIGLSGSSAASASVKAMVAMLEEQGAKVRLLMDWDPTNIPVVLEDLGALVLMGNDYDIDPAEYGAALHPETKLPADPRRMRYEKALVQEALLRKLPLLGVCGGMQRINIELGGTLHQHIPGQLGHNTHQQQSDATPFHVPVQFVRVQHDSVLASLAEPSAIAMPAHGVKEGLLIAENSIHHQAVATLGKGLKANARSIEAKQEHDIIEGFEVDPDGPLKDMCIMGMQFHPEFRASDIGNSIAGFLVHNAVAYAQAKLAKKAFNAIIVVRQMLAAQQRQHALMNPLTTIGKSDINLRVLHQLGVFRSIEELRVVPMEHIKQTLAQEHQNATHLRAPPKDKGGGPER